MKISKYLIVVFFVFQLVSTFGATIDPKILAQMQTDLKGALNGGLIPKVSENMPWAGGTLVRLSANEFGYTNTKNGYYETKINASTDLVKLAKDDSTINRQWVSQYGVDLAGAADTTKDQFEANRIAIDHVLQYGLSSLYTKDKPYVFNNGIAAFNDNGEVRYLLNNKVISQPDLLKTNEYKATVGSNVVAAKAAAAPVATSTPPSSNSNLEFIASANSSSIAMLIKAAKEYKSGNLEKDKFVQVALQVAGMADYLNKMPSDGSGATKIPTSAASLNNKAGNGPANKTPEAAPAKILIGTSNNGRDEIYVYKINSWDAKYGYKVLIVPNDPKSPTSRPYELLIPASQSSSKGFDNEAEYILNNIPNNFNVDKAADNKPVVTLEEGVSGRWHLLSTDMTCVNDFEITSQPSGNCKINDTAKSTNGGWANSLKAEDKACIDKGFKKVAYTMQFTCVADIFKNSGGQ